MVALEPCSWAPFSSCIPPLPWIPLPWVQTALPTLTSKGRQSYGLDFSAMSSRASEGLYLLNQNPGNQQNLRFVGSPDVELTLEELPDRSALASLLRNCSKLKALSDGMLVHAHICIHELEHDTFLGNCLVQVYGNCGSLLDAQGVFDALPNPNLFSWTILITGYVQHGRVNDASMVFDMMPERDSVTWNAMIAANARSGHSKEALELYDRMRLDGFELDNFTFVPVLEACTDLEDLEAGQEVHIAVIDGGYEQDVVVGTALVNMYGKCGSLDDAMYVFNRMPERNVVCWNAMITACVQNGSCEEALDLFRQMKGEGFKPSNVTFVCLLDACAALAASKEGQEIHRAIAVSEYADDDIVGTALVHMYGKCGDLQKARNAFYSIPRKNVVSWSAMIAACAQCENGKEALDLFKQMCLAGVIPDRVTYVSLLSACASLTTISHGLEIHDAIIKGGFEQDDVVGNALIDMYGKCRGMHEARSIFLQMSQRNVISWSAMMAAYGQNGHGEDALDLFYQMRGGNGIKLNYVTYLCALDVCATIGALEEGFLVHAAIVYDGYEHNVAVGSALIIMYGKCGSLDDARNAFSRTSQQNVGLWGAIIAACTQNGQRSEALNLFYFMQVKDITMNNIVFACILDACADLADLEEGQKLHGAIISSGYEQDVMVGNALMTMYGKCGSPQDAMKVFARLIERDSISWNAVIAACAQNGHGKDALDLYHQMQLNGVKPDKITFVGVLTACSHTGVVDKGRQFFVSITRDHSIPHTVEHYACMIDLLGRAGHLDEAEDLLDTMPLKNAHSTWSSFLAACRIHNDAERGRQAANYLVRLNLENSTPYIALSNTYAAGWQLDSG